MNERRRFPKRMAKAKVFFHKDFRKYVIKATTEERALHFLHKRLKADGYDPRNVIKVMLYYGQPPQRSNHANPWK